MKVAVIGAGIAGLSAALRLGESHDVTVFEANDYPGGHANTVDVEWQKKRYAIDTGFIVCNDRTYPNFIALLQRLGVPLHPSNMSFSLRCERSGLEYNGTSLNSLFAQRRNMVRPSFLRMIAEILRFNSKAPAALADPFPPTLGDYLSKEGYSRFFCEHYILPMGRAIWSAEARAMLDFPLRFFVEFFLKHGFLAVNDRPQWLAVRGGSREYVRKLLSMLRAKVRMAAPVTAVLRRGAKIWVRTGLADAEPFDALFLACHADQALALLQSPTAAEHEVLAAFPYAANEAILHTDASVLPRRRLARAAWNYHLLANAQEPVALTYDMNVLQDLQAPVRFLVSLNHAAHIDPAKIIRTFRYEHPVYAPAGVAAQERHREIDGTSGTYYCGAYWRYGFHEDGIVSAMSAVDHFEEDVLRAQRNLQRSG